MVAAEAVTFLTGAQGKAHKHAGHPADDFGEVLGAHRGFAGGDVVVAQELFQVTFHFAAYGQVIDGGKSGGLAVHHSGAAQGFGHPFGNFIETADKQLAGFLAEGADRASHIPFIGDNVGSITADQLAEGQDHGLQLFAPPGC